MADSIIDYTPLMFFTGSDVLVKVDDGSETFWDGIVEGTIRIQFIHAGSATYLGSGPYIVVQINDLDNIDEDGQGFTLHRIDDGPFEFNGVSDLYISPGQYTLVAIDPDTNGVAYLGREESDGSFRFTEEFDELTPITIKSKDNTGNLYIAEELMFSFGVNALRTGSIFKWSSKTALAGVRISNCVQQPGSCPTTTVCYDGKIPNIAQEIGVCYNAATGEDDPVCSSLVPGVCDSGFTCTQDQQGSWFCDEDLIDDNDLSETSFVKTIWFWVLIAVVAFLLVIIAFSAVIKSDVTE